MGSACNVARGSYVNHQDTLLAHSCGLLAGDTRVEVMPGDSYRIAVFAADAGSEITLNAVHLTSTANSPGGLVSASGTISYSTAHIDFEGHNEANAIQNDGGSMSGGDTTIKVSGLDSTGVWAQ